MLDIDFLASPPSEARLVIYRYRTGALRVAMRAAIGASVDPVAGVAWVSMDELGRYLTGPGLFGTPPPFAHDAADSDLDLDKLLDAAVSADIRLVAVFVHESNRSLRDERWRAIESRAIAVQEASPSPRSVEQLAAAFSNALGLASPENDKEAILGLLRKLASRGDDLSALKTAFDMASVLGSDTLRALSDDEEGNTGGVSIRSSLTEIIEIGVVDGADKLVLVSANLLSQRLTKRDVLSRVSRATCRALRAAGPAIAIHNLRVLLWAGMLLEFLDKGGQRWLSGTRTPPPDNFLESVRALAVRYLRNRPHVLDHTSKFFEGVGAESTWALVATLARTIVATCDTLSSVPPWVLALRAFAVSFEETGKRKAVSEVAGQAIVESRAEFTHFIGNAAVVGRIEKRLAAEEPPSVVVLTGPKAVGKATLARRLARQMLCQAPVQSNACGQCGACLEFNSGITHPLSYVPPIDLSDADAGEKLAAIVHKIRSGSVTGRFVAILDQVDECRADAFDVLLKTLESLPTGMTIIMLAMSLAKMRQAGLSRAAAVYHLKPLGIVESHELVRSRFPSISDNCASLLVELGAGLPGRLIPMIQRLPSEGQLDPSLMRARLDLGWIGDGLSALATATVLNAWRPPSLMNPPRVNEARAAELWSRLMMRKGGDYTAIWSSALNEPLRLVQYLADLLGVERQVLWRTVADHLLR